MAGARCDAALRLQLRPCATPISPRAMSKPTLPGSKIWYVPRTWLKASKAQATRSPKRTGSPWTHYLVELAETAWLASLISALPAAPRPHFSMSRLLQCAALPTFSWLV